MSNVVTYFIGNRSVSKIKIGKTNCIQIRFTALQCGSPVELELFGVCDGNIEKQLHTRFSEYHSHGEWFLLSQEIEDFIALHTHIPQLKSQPSIAPFHKVPYESVVKEKSGPQNLDSITNYGFQRRTIRALLINNISSIWDIPKTDQELFMLRGIGEVVMEDIKKVCGDIWCER